MNRNAELLVVVDDQKTVIEDLRLPHALPYTQSTPITREMLEFVDELGAFSTLDKGIQHANPGFDRNPTTTKRLAVVESQLIAAQEENRALRNTLESQNVHMDRIRS
jgi:hypothetical protein